ATKVLRLVEVGRATLRPDTPFAAFVEPAGQNGTSQVAHAVRYHTPQPSPTVLAEGVDGLSRTPELATFYRAYAWFVPIRGGDVHPWAIGAFRRSITRVQAEVGAVSDLFQVTAPTDALAAGVDSSRAASRRLLLLGGEAAALLLAFTILAAVALRREVGDARRRLVWHGARRWQVELFTFAEAAAVAVAATVAGWAAGAGVAAVVAARAGSPAGAVIAHGLRALGRAGRRGPVALRLAALSLARNPGHAAVAATFLVASLGLALFASTYRSTLLQGQRDEAAYAAPAPYVATEDLAQL